ncbi:uncharacterized protein LOC132181498 [Corylus avellana]|uniref:uncharacterized protein LOC132181498 n=1 Tax=Corylus avellana TaxID=13451 RepID=UPI00286BEC4A|nr:uncharacterized protein LOC132181498 [Corylus avellana]
MWMLRAAKCIAIRFLASKGTSTTLTASLPSTFYFFEALAATLGANQILYRADTIVAADLLSLATFLLSPIFICEQNLYNKSQLNWHIQAGDLESLMAVNVKKVDL